MIINREWRGHRVRVAMGTALLGAFAVSGCGGQTEPKAHENAPTVRGTVYASSDDRLPSTSATDWVTYADHVVAVTATSQKEVPPDGEEVEIGEGLIGREVTLRVDEVVWSRNASAKPAPATFKWNGMGWQFTDGDTNHRSTMVLEDQPRVEPGHSYILAIDWVGSRCTSGDGEWLGLGEGAIVAYDGGTIGVGEFEGDAIDLRRARRIASGSAPDTGIEEALVGDDATELAARLKRTEPTERAPAFRSDCS